MRLPAPADNRRARRLQSTVEVLMTTLRFGPFRVHRFERRLRCGGYGVRFTHAHPNGYAVLISESSWRTLNGISIVTRTAHWVLMFRRVG